MVAVASGLIVEHEKTWVKYTILITISISLFVVVTVPEHFLKDHLWGHILKVHILKTFLWALGALLLIHFINEFIDVSHGSRIINLVNIVSGH